MSSSLHITDKGNPFPISLKAGFRNLKERKKEFAFGEEFLKVFVGRYYCSSSTPRYTSHRYFQAQPDPAFPNPGELANHIGPG